MENCEIKHLELERKSNELYKMMIMKILRKNLKNILNKKQFKSVDRNIH